MGVNTRNRRSASRGDAARLPISNQPPQTTEWSEFGALDCSEKGVPLPKFGEWDVNDPASAEGFTVIFNKARTEKQTGGRPDSPSKEDRTYKQGAVLGKPPSKKWFCCLRSES